MPKFLTEAARESYVAKCAEARKLRKQKQPERAVPRLSLAEIDAAIETLRRVRQTLLQEAVSV